MVPAITKYMSALDGELLARSTGTNVEGTKKDYDARKQQLEARLAGTDVAPDVRVGVDAMLDSGQALLNNVASNTLGLRARVTTYAPILLTAENAIDGSVRVDNEQIRAAAQGLSRAIGARGQMMMQQLLIIRGADLPEPELRTSMITLAGTEPSTLFGMAEVLGVGSADAKTLQQQMVTRMGLMSDPATKLVNNKALLDSVQITDKIAAQIITDTTAKVTKAVEDQARNRHNAAIRDTVLVLAAIAAALIVVLLVARSLVRPLRVLRDGALKVAHEDLEREITRVRAGDESAPEPLPVHTTEEIGQVAHAVDELHTQALLLAGDESRLRHLVNDMFETMSRRNRSLVDQQLSLIDRLERNEEDPERLDSLFRLDHLAARMRRNGANLLVLAGAQNSRGDPVLGGKLRRVDHTQHLVEIASRAHRIDQDELDLLVRTDDEHVADGLIIVRRTAFRGPPRARRQHAVSLGDLQVGIADHWIVRGRSGHVLDIGGPFLVVVDRIDRKPDDLDAALVEFRLEPRHGAEFCGADRRKVLGMREQDHPIVADPVVKADFAFRRVSFEIRCGIADCQRHGNLLDCYNCL